MKLFRLSFIITFIFIFQFCSDTYIIQTDNTIPSNTSFETDIDFLNEIIIQNNISAINIENIGIQKWEDNRLVEFEISDNLDLYIIPNSINYLDKLNKLILRNNSIVHIPSSICQLSLNFSDINKFDINGNYLCYSDIPYCLYEIIDPFTQSCEWNNSDMLILQDIININGLDISLNDFGGMQTWSLGRLTSLNLSGNDGYGLIHTLPDNIDQLNKLKIIDLNNHLLTVLPENFGYLQDLESINLSSNRIIELPESFGFLYGLFNLNLFDNRLSYLPNYFMDLHSCNYLDLSFNQFINFPEEILELSNLEELNLSINYLITIPSNISNLTNLNWLDLHFNEINYIPESIIQLNYLEYLDLGYNSITNLPSNFGNIANLNTLYFDNNEINLLPELFCELNINFTNPYNFMINNNNLCIDDVPFCMNSEILGNQNCIESIEKNGINN
jgi:Leucine-rich repeat (LRR) protein